MGGQSQELPSYSRYESEFLNLPPEQMTYRNALDIAIKKGFPAPYEAANEVIKKSDADRKRIKESLPVQPTGTVPLDVPLAQSIKDVTGGRMNYLQAAPMQKPPLGMQGGLPIGIEDLLAALPQDFQLPSPIQNQQPALSFFGPQALGELPQQVTQEYIPSTIPEKVMSAMTRQPDITSFPSGTNTRTVLRDPITGLPSTDIATAPRQILTPEQQAFQKLSPDEQKKSLTKSLVNIDMGQPPPPSVQETVSGALDTLKNLNIMEQYVGESGRLKGLWNIAGAWIGTNEDAIAFETARNNIILSQQSIIKGIPSNYDVKININTIAALWLPEKTNRQRIKLTREITKNLLHNSIAFYKNTKQTFPQQIIEQAKEFGIDVDKVSKWDGKGDPLKRGKVPVEMRINKKNGRTMIKYADGTFEYAD